MGLVSLLFQNPAFFIVLAFFLLYSIILHEIAHGYVAHLFGDDTAVRYGRLTLNPASHLDPIGTLMLFLVGFGWARPVPVNYNNIRSRFGLFCVALAGCMTNILIAALGIFLLQFRAIGMNPAMAFILPILVKINIILGSFNLIPIPPLDGSKVLTSFLSWRAQEKLARIEPYGFFILIFLIFTGVLAPFIYFMQNLIYGVIAALFGFFR